MNEKQLLKLIKEEVGKAVFSHLVTEQEFTTKGNKPIEFKIHEQSPRPQDNLGRGWIVHRIEAFIEGKEVGYINISYIPKTRFEYEYPTLLQYLDKIEGRSAYPGKAYATDGVDYYSEIFDELPTEVQIHVLERMLHFNGGEQEHLDEKGLIKRKQELMKELNRKFGQKFADFKEFNMDKPLVDYIKVEDHAQRQRVGIALYEKAAKWLATKGLNLHASGIQSDAAKASWEWLRQNKGANIGQTKSKDKSRTYLSYT